MNADFVFNCGNPILHCCLRARRVSKPTCRLGRDMGWISRRMRRGVMRLFLSFWVGMGFEDVVNDKGFADDVWNTVGIASH